VSIDPALIQDFSAAEFRRRAGRHALPPRRDDYGDHRLNPDLTELIVRQGLRDAAVLVGVVDRGAQASVLLTKRTEAMRSHSGQIAFPGGRIDRDDLSPQAAALRETAEEVGIASESIELVGRLPDYVTGSGYRIVPVLGIIRPDYLLTINADEVDDAFEVPLAFLMASENHRRERAEWNGLPTRVYAISFGDRTIWGVTAGIIRNLWEQIYRA